tara:strand:- start:5284 stop:6858 length:1575 start_codon:yes stop_codon:yes gene_type:complete
VIQFLLIFASLIFSQATPDDLDGLPDKQKAFCSEVKVLGSSKFLCHYHSLIPADKLIQRASLVLDEYGMLPEDYSLQKQDGHGYFVQFIAPSESEANHVKRILMLEDNRNFDYTPIRLTVKFYYLSHAKARNKGFNLRLIGEGPVPDNLPRLAGGPLFGLTWNIGNLTDRLLRINLDYARDYDVMELSEMYELNTYDGYMLDVSADQIFYPGNTVTLKEETVQKGFSGTVRLDTDDPKKIYLDDFVFIYPEVLNQDNTIAKSKTIGAQSFSLDSGITKVIYKQDIKKEVIANSSNIMQSERSKSFENIRFIVTVTATYMEEMNPMDVVTKENPFNNLYYFTSDYKDGLRRNDIYEPPVAADYHALEKLFTPENFEITVVPSVLGSRKQNIAFMLAPRDKKIPKNLLDAPIILSAKSGDKEVHYHWELENVLAGPVVLNGLDIGYDPENPINDIAVGIALNKKDYPEAWEDLDPIQVYYGFKQNPSTFSITPRSYYQYDQKDECYLRAHSTDPDVQKKYDKKKCY